ncbi:DUF736 domain-containing protein [uncultured Novosphingobium sp.]|uniref:DUF736 domain-containing protein n=1 Tax=uncultured Novosphingobium sp. TaxID=292277 RepID=UPI002594F95A|nr:DUF736 domain-containing protein [uncultured Novosphingobium sp.]
MNIGTFKLVNGQLLGSIATVSIDLARLGMRPVDSDNEKAPAYEIVALNVARRWVQIGALWEATSNSTGEVFYQGRLEDPSLAEPLQIMLFGDPEEGYRVVWNRQSPRREAMDGTRQPRRRQRDDAFGEGNATDDGRLAEQLNEEIPAF